MVVDILIDGMHPGTGIRDAVNGGYLDMINVCISEDLRSELTDWLNAYASAYYKQYKDFEMNEKLDKWGIEIARKVRRELPDKNVEYYSDYKLRRINI